MHANEHLHSNFLAKMDFSEFFPSIGEKWLRAFLLDNVNRGVLPLAVDAVPDVVRLCCRADADTGALALSIGSPSSPALSNSILFELDKMASQMCVEAGCLYTRYADDIYISSRDREVVSSSAERFRGLVKDFSPYLSFNEAKYLNVSRKSRRKVTGMMLTPDRRLSVGRDLKRKIKTEIYLWSLGQLSLDKTSHLCGLISYVRGVEPVFYDALSKKFGDKVVEELFRSAPRRNGLDEIPF
jgi:RNA-directed DNA polymerase